MNSLRVKWNVSVLKVEVKVDENKRVLFLLYKKRFIEYLCGKRII